MALAYDNILVSADNSGIMRWNSEDKYSYVWKVGGEPPLYVCGGTEGRAIAIAKDAVTAISMETKTGSTLSAAVLPSKAIGDPVLHGDKYYIPIEAGMLVLRQDLEIAAKFQIASISGPFSMGFSNGFAYLVGNDFVLRLRAY